MALEPCRFLNKLSYYEAEYPGIEDPFDDSIHHDGCAHLGAINSGLEAKGERKNP